MIDGVQEMDDMIREVGTAALAAMLENRFGKKGKEKSSMEKHSDLGKIVRNILIVIGVIAVVCGVIYAVVKFLQPKGDDEYSFLHPRDDGGDEEDEEEFRDDPDIAEEFDEEQ